MRRTIITDAQGRYKFRSIMPAGWLPAAGPPRAAEPVGRHGNRPAHIHFFVTATARKLTTQINIEGDPLIWTTSPTPPARPGAAAGQRPTPPASRPRAWRGPFAEIVFDIS
jgi:catechol 1,2-dioxygenase